MWKWVEEYGGRICDQLRRIGSSVDWSRKAFTMDDNLSVRRRPGLSGVQWLWGQWGVRRWGRKESVVGRGKGTVVIAAGCVLQVRRVR